MDQDIFKQYPSSEPDMGRKRAKVGGETVAKPLKYNPPQGPTEQMRSKPGLGGDVHMCGSQGKH